MGMDYERALNLAKEYVQTSNLRRKFSILENRLHENLEKENLHGSTEQTRSDRSVILDQLNQLLFPELGINFNDLLAGEKPIRIPTRISVQEDQAQLQLAPQQRSTPIEVFIGCSAEDKLYLDELRTHLEPFVQSKDMLLWDEEHIRPGSVKSKEIEQAVQTAEVAVLLVSAYFLAAYKDEHSLMRYQVPQLMKRAGKNEVTILVVLVRPSLIGRSLLSELQPINPGRALSALNKASDREDIWMQVADAIFAAGRSQP